MFRTYAYNPKDYTDYPNGARVYRSYGPFSAVVRVTNCPCEDGARRLVRMTAHPDTFFTQPAAIRVNGRTVTGYVTLDDEGPKFVANKLGRNYQLIHTRDHVDTRE